MIESKGSLANTFRIKSTGKAGRASDAESQRSRWPASSTTSTSRSTRTAIRSPTRGPKKKKKSAPTTAENSAKNSGALSLCGSIEFAEGEDSVNGPMHTDDAAVVCGGLESGGDAKGERTPRPRGNQRRCRSPEAAAAARPIYNTSSGKSEVGGEEIVAAKSDGSLHAYVEREPTDYEFTGRTTLELEGSKDKTKST